MTTADNMFTVNNQTFDKECIYVVEASTSNEFYRFLAFNKGKIVSFKYSWLTAEFKELDDVAAIEILNNRCNKMFAHCNPLVLKDSIDVVYKNTTRSFYLSDAKLVCLHDKILLNKPNALVISRMSLTLKTFDCALFYDKSYDEFSVVDKKYYEAIVKYMDNKPIVDASGMQINMNNILDAVLDNLSWSEIQELVEPIINEDSSSEYEPSGDDDDEYEEDCDWDDIVEESDTDDIVYERDDEEEADKSLVSRVNKKRKI